MSGAPYRDAAGIYFRKGWTGVLPIKGKWPPPKGWTGTDGAVPSFADVLAWSEGSEGELNVGLRLPAHVLGIDVDAYAGKRGAETLAEHEARLGPLPATWISTSRDDGVSGIRLFIVPEGLHWPGVLPGGDVDIIQLRHRYVMAWPSIHPEGREYVWLGPDGTRRPVPHVGELPNLPDAWIAALTQGKTAADIERADLGDAQASDWLLEHGKGEPCEHMARAIVRAEGELTAGASRHDAAMRATARITRMISEGHAGALAALGRVRGAFDAALTGSRGDLSGEWQRLVAGAVRIAAVAPVQAVDPCQAGVFGTSMKPTGPLSRPDPAQWRDTFTSGALAEQPQPRQDVPSAPSVPSTHPDPFGAPTAQPGTADEVVHEATSWSPIDLGPILSGEHTEEPPAVLRRVDGAALFYLGRVNGLIGPSESGKSWVALAAVAQELDAGETVVYLDFEDTARGIVGRLLGLGVDPAAVLERFAYIGPDEAPGAAQLADLAAVLAEREPRLVVLDGFNAAMALAGLDLMSNTDATRFHQGLLRPITRDDRAIVYIDHTPKNKADESAGGIGAQAKRAMTSGCAIRVDKKDDFGPGVTGYLKLTIDKDRAGMVREIAAQAKYAGEAVITSTAGGSVEIVIQAWDPRNAQEKAAEAAQDDLGRRVLEGLASHPDSTPDRLRAEIGGNRDAIRTTLARLVDAGQVIVVKGARNAQLHRINPAALGVFGTLDRSKTENFQATSPDLARPRPGEVDRTTSTDLARPLRSRAGLGEVSGALGVSGQRDTLGEVVGEVDEIAGLDVRARLYDSGDES